MAAAGAAVAGCTRKKEGLPPLEEAKPYREQQPATSTPTATATEKVVPTATATEEVVPTATATEKVVPTVTEQPIAAQTEIAIKNWPKTRGEAAKMFGGKSSDWETNPDGGWHFIERGNCEEIDPNGYLMEGYYDQDPGKNPFCFVTWGSAAIQGGTIWPVAGSIETAEDLIEKMAISKWDDGSQHPCQIINPAEKQGE